MTKIAKMSSTKAAQELEGVRERLADVKARIGEIRPPRPAPPGPPGGTGLEWDPMTGAGPEYAAAHEAGDVATLHALRDELERLSIEEEHLLRRREQLRQRERAAKADEERKAAPGRAKKIAKEFPTVVERVAAAVEELREARSEVEQLLRDLAAARKLVGDDAPGLTPEDLGAFWHAPLRPGERLDIEVETPSGPTLDAARVRECRQLVALPAGVVNAVADYLEAGRPTDEIQRARLEEDARLLVAREIVRAIASGGPTSGRELSAATIERIRRSPGVSPSRVRRETESWLDSRSRDRVGAR